MDKYINKQILDDIRIPEVYYVRSDYNRAYRQGCKAMLALVKSIPPAADVRENIKGKWELRGVTATCLGGHYDCSQCGAMYDGEYYFCPNCGADMRGNYD